MEGPTPVSSLIHAATMVTAGVYLIARSHPLFELAPTAADIAAFIGLATLLFAATVALAVTDLKRIIAYSTISQIGYMIVGVSIGAYAAGLFHLMTHAFFKALLFMAAGSIIGAMAGAQNIDRMRGFRKALPFTGAAARDRRPGARRLPAVLGLLLEGRDPRLRRRRAAACTGSSRSAATSARLLTAFYAFRITFRVVPASRARRRRSSRRATSPTPSPPTRRPARPRTPTSASPGPGHYIAEREIADEDRDGRARLPRDVRRLAADPRRHRGRRHLPRADLRGLAAVAIDPSTAPPTSGSRSARRSRRSGSGSPTTSTSSRRGRRPASAPAPRALHAFLLNKWYFDELYDAVVYRPVIALGRFANSVFERVVVQGIVNGDGRRGPRRRRRSSASAQSGFVRAYALLVIGGFAGARPLLPDREQLMLPGDAVAAASPSGSSASSPRRRLVRIVPVARLGRDARPRGDHRRRLRPRRRRPPARRRRELDPRPRRPLPARHRRDQRLPRRADRAALGGGDALVRVPPARAAARNYFLMLGLAETATLGAFLAQDLLLFVLFFDLMLVPFYFLIGAWGGENRSPRRRR